MEEVEPGAILVEKNRGWNERRIREHARETDQWETGTLVGQWQTPKEGRQTTKSESGNSADVFGCRALGWKNSVNRYLIQR